jgi:thiamine-monophosphate kinase
VGERDLVEILRRTLTRGRRGVAIDIGDDAAVLARFRGDLVLSVDASVENVHFRRSWAGLDVLAARAFEAAVSDLAAMGSEPVGALLALGLPRASATSDVRAIARGVARVARRSGCPVVGGNVTRSSDLSITTTVVGRGERHLRRDGARVGDAVFVTGPLGAAALGLRFVESARRSRVAAPFVRRLLAPRARLAAGLALRGIAHACIDVSDGLVADLGHVAAASAVAIEIDAALVPRLRGHDRVARTLGVDGVALALAGGEDYELAFTAPADARLPIRATRVGRVLRGRGVRVIGARLGADGHDHFR